MSLQPPAPRVNADGIEYWQSAEQGKLVLRECAACGKVHFPPRHLCPACWSDDLRWCQASGEGRVYTFTVMRRAPLPEFAGRLPYVVALVDLAEGPRMMANIVGEDAFSVAIGDRVRVCFEQRGERRLPQFMRAQARSADAERRP
jgi:uncharacterized OB-fold protein